MPLGCGVRSTHWFLAVRGGRIALVGHCVRALAPADHGAKGPRCLASTLGGGWIEASRLLGAEKIASILNVSLYSRDQIVESGESEYILHTTKDKRTPETDQYLNEFVKRLSVEIAYESAYKETFVATWNGERRIFF